LITRILLLTDGLYPFSIGGMQKHSTNLMLCLAEDPSIELCVVHTSSTKRSPNFLREFGEAIAKKVREIYIPFPSYARMPGHYIRSSYKYSCLIWNRLESDIENFDFIYAKGFSAWKFLQESKKRTLPPIGVNFHGYEMFQPSASFRHSLELRMLAPFVRWNVQAAHYVFSYGAKITTLLKERLNVDGSRIVEIPGAVDAQWLEKDLMQHKNQVRRFVFLGRYERRKGVEELNFVLKDLPNPAPVEFHFIGPIPVDKQIDNRSFHYHGGISEADMIRNELLKSDVLVCPSLSEGMPNSIMEGMACGNAIIATDVGASSLLVDAENGWLLPLGDSQALSLAIQDAIDIPQADLVKMRLSSLDRMASFTWEEIGRRTIQTLKLLVIQPIDKGQ